MQLVVTQSILYGIAYLNVAIWGTLGTIFYLAGIEIDSLGKHYWLTFLANTFFPIHGFFYFCIYIRPSYMRERKRQRQQQQNGDGGGGGTRWEAFSNAIWKNKSSSSKNGNHHNHTNDNPTSSSSRNSSNIGGTMSSKSHDVPGITSNVNITTTTPAIENHQQYQHSYNDEDFATTTRNVVESTILPPPPSMVASNCESNIRSLTIPGDDDA